MRHNELVRVVRALWSWMFVHNGACWFFNSFSSWTRERLRSVCQSYVRVMFVCDNLFPFFIHIHLLIFRLSLPPNCHQDESSGLQISHRWFPLLQNEGKKIYLRNLRTSQIRDPNVRLMMIMITRFGKEDLNSHKFKRRRWWWSLLLGHDIKLEMIVPSSPPPHSAFVYLVYPLSPFSSASVSVLFSFVFCIVLSHTCCPPLFLLSTHATKPPHYHHCILLTLSSCCLRKKESIKFVFIE